MIASIENALIERLKRGLGNLVREVTSYAGQLDSEQAARTFPAAWVVFGGIQDTKPVAQSNKRTNQAFATFSVMVATRVLRSNQKQGIGAYDLVYAVRRLLMQQDLTCVNRELKIDALMPTRVRSLVNSGFDANAMVVYACEFTTSWYESGLTNTSYPRPDYRVKTKDSESDDGVTQDDSLGVVVTQDGIALIPTDPTNPDNVFLSAKNQASIADDAKHAETGHGASELHLSVCLPNSTSHRVESIIPIGESND